MIGKLRQTEYTPLLNRFSISNAGTIAMKRAKSLLHVCMRFRVAAAFGTLIAVANVCSAQTQAQPQSGPASNVATLYGSESPDGHSASASAVAANPDLGISPALANKLA